MNTRVPELPEEPRELALAHGAPLRIDAAYALRAAPEAVFAVIADLQGIARFFPMIQHASVAHPRGCVGEGSERVCSIRGMGKVRERIVWWREPVGYAYRAQGTLMPLRNHLGLIVLERMEAGGTRLVWRQYFDTRFGLLGWVFPWMMRRLMNRAIGNIARMTGG